MNKEKTHYNSNLQSNTEKKSNESYPPHNRTHYHPSRDDVESATGVDFPVNMPNPAVDPIVSNNIANQEFDYTEDMTTYDD